MKSIAILVFLCAILEFTRQDFAIRILHTENFRSKFGEIVLPESNTQKKGFGIARMINYVKQTKASATIPTFYFDTMDCFTGSVWFRVHGWKICAAFMKIMPVDAFCVGDSEMSYGKVHEREKHFEDFLKNLGDKIVLCVNCDVRSEPRFNKLTKSTVLEAGAFKVGVIGYIAKGLVPVHMGKMRILDEIKAILAEVENLNASGVYTIILLMHAPSGWNKEIVGKTHGISLVLGGHAHKFFYNGVPAMHEINVDGPYPVIYKNAEGIDVPIFHAGPYGQFVGQADLTFDENGTVISADGNPVYMDYHIQQDDEAKNLLATFAPQVEKKMNTIIGTTRVFLSGKCAECECNLGNLIADAFIEHGALHYHHKDHWADVPIALLHAGGVTFNIDFDSKKNNTISVANIGDIFPYGQLLVTLRMTGEVLRNAFEYAVSTDVDDSPSTFLQVSGIIVHYNLTKAPLHRVDSLKARCAECDIPHYQDVVNTHKYNVIVPEYIADGGEGFSMFRDQVISRKMSTLTESEILEDYIQRHKIIQATTEERIVIIERKRN